VHSYDFPILLVIVIGIAKLYPPFGATYLKPDTTASWLAVALIFRKFQRDGLQRLQYACIDQLLLFLATSVIMGITLKSEELKKSFKRFKFTLCVPIFNFFVDSAIVFVVSQALVRIEVVTRVLADGMVICSCLPVAINSVVILTATAKCAEAAAVFQAVAGNMVGIFLSSLLILGYLGKSGNAALGTVFYQLTLRVIVPVIVGQILQNSFQRDVDFSKKHKCFMSKSQQYLLVSAVYPSFARPL
jgi:sodium/bile acid cotransporter 7